MRIGQAINGSMIMMVYGFAPHVLSNGVFGIVVQPVVRNGTKLIDNVIFRWLNPHPNLSYTL